MNQTPSFGASEVQRLRRRDLIRRLLHRDKTPLLILIMAALVGTLAGLVGVAFEKAVNWVQYQRLDAIAGVADRAWFAWPLVFIASAILAALGY